MHPNNISVIVPVYNTPPDLLIRCLDSILRQSYHFFELLIIDDGSTSIESADICDSFAEKDERVTVFHTENHGLGGARNFGISKAHGTWIGFVDSDDWCETDYLKDFQVETYSEADLILQGFVWEQDDMELGRKKIHASSCDKSGLSEFYFQNDLLNFGSAWCKLFKKDIFNKFGLLYPITFSYGEDSAFFPKYIQHCNKIIGIPQEHYHYVHYAIPTMSRSVHDTERLLEFIVDSTRSLTPLFSSQEYGKQIATENNRKCVVLSMRAYVNMYVLYYEKERKRKCVHIFQKDVRPLLNGKGLPFKERLFFHISGLSPRVQLLLLGLLQRLKIING